MDEVQNDFPVEEFPEQIMSSTICGNPFCPDFEISREVPLGVSRYYCGTCGARMLPPEEGGE